MRKQNGFTLIELMIVVAIIGILAAIAIPAYRDFQVRSKISEVLAAMGACKTTVAEFYESNDGFTNRQNIPIQANICEGDNVNPAGKSRFMETISVSPVGIISATEQDTGATNGGGGIIVMGPFESDGTTAVAGPGQEIGQWICGIAGTTVEARFRPGSCQG